MQWRCGSELPGQVSRISLWETCTLPAVQNDICKLVLSTGAGRCSVCRPFCTIGQNTWLPVDGKWWLWLKQRLVVILVGDLGKLLGPHHPSSLSHAVNLGWLFISPCWVVGWRVSELPSPGCAAKSTAVFVMSLISSLLKTKCLWILLQQCSSHLSAASHSHYPPALPVGCEESCWWKDERAISLRKESSLGTKLNSDIFCLCW